MQTSRNEGMITREKYIEKLIYAQNHLITPKISFSRFVEVFETKRGRSSMMKEDEKPSVYLPRFSGFLHPKDRDLPSVRKDQKCQYMISSTPSIEDVLSQKLADPKI
jgi:hypothetical protein